MPLGLELLERRRVHVLDLHSEHVALLGELPDHLTVAKAALQGTMAHLTRGRCGAAGAQRNEANAQAMRGLAHHTAELAIA